MPAFRVATSTPVPVIELHCDRAMNPGWPAGRSGSSCWRSSRFAPTDLCLNHLSDVERRAGFLASALAATRPDRRPERCGNPAASDHLAGRASGDAPTSGRACTENPRTASESRDAALDAETTRDPFAGATMSPVAGNRTPTCVGMRVLRGLMA